MGKITPNKPYAENKIEIKDQKTNPAVLDFRGDLAEFPYPNHSTSLALTSKMGIILSEAIGKGL